MIWLVRFLASIVFNVPTCRKNQTFGWSYHGPFLSQLPGCVNNIRWESNSNQPQRCVTTNDNWQILKILHNENSFKDPLWQEQLWKSSMTRTIFKIRHNNNFKDPLWQEQFWKSATTTILKIRHNNNFENPPPGLSFHLTWAVFVVSVRLTSFQGSNVLLTFLLEVCEPLIESDVAPNFQPEYQLIVHLPRLLLNGIPRHVTVSSSRRQLYDKVFSR